MHFLNDIFKMNPRHFLFTSDAVHPTYTSSLQFFESMVQLYDLKLPSILFIYVFTTSILDPKVGKIFHTEKSGCPPCRC